LEGLEHDVGATFVVALLADAVRKTGRPQGSPLQDHLQFVANQYSDEYYFAVMNI
jgi:hypothetical protein